MKRVPQSLKWMIAYGLGQVTQLIIHYICLANNLYVYRQIPFCVIAGVVLMGAILIGTLLGEQSTYTGAHEETEEEIGTHPHKSFDELKAEIIAKTDRIEEVIPVIYEQNTDRD